MDDPVAIHTEGWERESEREVAAGGRATEAAYMTVLVLTPEPVAALGKVQLHRILLISYCVSVTKLAPRINVPWNIYL